MSKNSLNFIDMFSGIGGFRTGLERAGHKCIGFSEIDKYAIQSYKAIYDTEDEIELGDISKISDKELSLLEDKVDIIVGGSPCFRKGTMITTIDGLKPIEYIKVGDLVLTHKDRFKEVVLPMVNHTESIYELQCMNSQKTFVTDEHPIRVVEKINNDMFSEEKWVKVKDLIKGKHYVRLSDSSEDEKYAHILKLEKMETDENVYNFEVEDDNSYVANNMVVHNCQSFSNAGRRLGFEDTRGTLFFEYARMIKDTQPKYFIYENVKGMLSHDNNKTFEIVLNTFNELGYYIDFNIFNSKFYGVPQDRERVYIVGVRKDLLDNVEKHERKPKTLLVNRANNWAIENVDSYVKILPELKDTQNTTISDILEDIFSEKQLLREDFLDKVRLNDDLSGKINHWAYRSRDDIRSLFGVSPTLLTMQGGNDEPKIAFPVEGYHKPFGRHNHNEGVNFIITDKDNNEVIEKNVLKMIEVHEPTKYLTDDRYELKLTLEPELIGTLTKNQNGTLYLKDNVIYKHNKLDENDLENIQYSSKIKNPTLMFPNLNFALILNDDKSKCYIVKDLDTHYDIIRVIDKENIEFIGSDTFEIVPRVAIRKLSPLECWRLQGFSDEQYFKAKATGITKSQLLKQAGNSVTTNIVEYIAKNVIK